MDGWMDELDERWWCNAFQNQVLLSSKCNSCSSQDSFLFWLDEGMQVLSGCSWLMHFQDKICCKLTRTLESHGKQTSLHTTLGISLLLAVPDSTAKEWHLE